MKKTVKMLLLAFLIIVIALMAVACSKGFSYSLIPSLPIRKLNGMNAAQLVEKAINDYNNSSTLEVQIKAHYYNGTKYVTDLQCIKRDGEDFYYLNEDCANIHSARRVEIFLLDDMAYIDYEQTKIKCYRDDIDVVWGEDFLDPFIYTLEQNIAKEYLSKAKIYRENDVYFFSILVPVPETNLSRTQTVYFDENGKITKIIDEVSYSVYEHTIKYDVPVEIASPGNKYRETPKLPKTDAEIYQLYVAGCTAIQESPYMWAELRSVAGINSIYYNRNGENKHIRVLADSQYIQHWLSDNNGYTMLEDGSAFKTPVNEEFLNVFTSVEDLFPIIPYPQEELENFNYRYDKDLSQSKISFERVDESGTRCYYKCTIPNNMSDLKVVINKNPGTVIKEEANFYFNIYDDRKVTPPSIP